MSIFNLLEGDATTGTPWMNYVLIGLIVVAIVVMFIFSGRRNKQSQKEYEEQMAAIKPGNKVLTRGGICGVVVEVCDDDETIVFETGSETTGKSYIRLEKSQIFQTDAKGPTQIAREAAEAAKKAEREAKAAEKNGRAAASEAGLPEPSDDAFEDMAAPSAAETPAETPAETSEETSEEANK